MDTISEDSIDINDTMDVDEENADTSMEEKKPIVELTIEETTEELPIENASGVSDKAIEDDITFSEGDEKEDNDAEVAEDEKIDILDSLFENCYKNLSKAEQKVILEAERPKPLLENIAIPEKIKDGAKRIPKSFDPMLYDMHDWLCGSKTLEKLYCWPCILFGKDEGLKDSGWNIKDEGGSPDPEHISDHEKSYEHISAAFKLQFAIFSQTTQTSEKDLASQIQHNRMVERKKKIMIDHINRICASVMKDEHENQQNFNDIPEISLEMKHNLIKAIEQCLTKSIRLEIEYSNYVAIMLDDVTDLLSKPKLSCSFRYIFQGELFERFIRFIDKKDAIEIAVDVFDILDEFGCQEKLVGQTYDGATMMPSGNVQDIIREEIPSAVFYNCHSLSVNTVLSKAISKIKNCRLFFASCNAFITFFNYSAKLNPDIQKLITIHVPKSIQSESVIKSLIVDIVYDNIAELRVLVSKILENPDRWNAQIILEVMGLRNQLKNFEFIFLLQMFIGIHNETNKLFFSLKSKRYEKDACAEQLELFNIKINEMKENDFEMLYAKTVDLVTQVEDQHFDLVKLGADTDRYKKLHDVIYEEVKKIINFRINTITNSNFVDLLYSADFKKFNKKFPIPIFEDCLKLYPKQLDRDQLRSELQIVYGSTIFENKTVLQIFDILEQKNFKKPLKMLYRLVTLMLTIPTTSVADKVAYMNRIEDYCRKQSKLFTRDGDKMELLEIECNLLKRISQKDFFLKEVFKNVCCNKDDWYKMI